MAGVFTELVKASLRQQPATGVERIRIDTITGASAGAMTGLIAARALLQDDAAALAAPGPLALRAGACRRGAGCFEPRGGFPGLDAPPAGTMGLAVGRRQLLQVAGDVMAVYNLGATGTRRWCF
jgi:hypothetical protein